MADYTEYKKRRFDLRKEASEWSQKEKGRVNSVMKIKIDINYHPSEPLPWEAVLLVRN